MSKGQLQRTQNMGMAASQARLLSITSRIHDVEYQAQQIQSAKMQLALQEDDVYRKYNEALDATTLTFQDQKGNRIQATFNNLCGLGSIGNNIATNKNYVFRDGSDNLIVPSDVYEGFMDFGGDDPYAFALYMLMGNTGLDDPEGAIENAQMDHFDNIAEEDSSYLGSIKEQIENLINGLWKYSTDYLQDDDNEEGYKEDFLNDALGCRWDIIERGLTEEGVEFLKDSKLKEKCEEYKHKVFKHDAKDIYGSISGCDAEDFDQEKFDYYLRWGKLIQQEEGIEYCTKAGDYGKDIENDAEVLNQMLQSGRISIDLVYVDNKTGQVSDDPTSPASDTNIAYTTKSSIDSRELKKAEAEYEKAMKDIDKKDKRFDMDLNRLETERTALTTEYDSVKQVIKDNIERTFGIFS